MIPTCRRPATVCFWLGPWPCTSADGLSTRRYSAGKPNCVPSSKSISRIFSAVFKRISTGQCRVPRCCPRPPVIAARSSLAGACHRLSAGLGLRRLVEAARLVDQHNRNAVADRIGEAGLIADELIGLAVVSQGSLGQ